MIKIVKKRVFGNNSGFHVKEDPNTWTEGDLEHLSRVIIRVSKKFPIKMITYNGVNNYKQYSTKFMDFDIKFDTSSKSNRNTNLKDIKMMLIMECL